MKIPEGTKIGEAQRAELQELIAYLRTIPSRHRHLLFVLDSPLYFDLNAVEDAGKELANKVEALLKKHS